MKDITIPPQFSAVSRVELLLSRLRSQSKNKVIKETLFTNTTGQELVYVS